MYEGARMTNALFGSMYQHKMKNKTGCRDLIPSADQICKHTVISLIKTGAA